MAQECFVANPRLLQALQSRADLVDCSENKTLFRQGDPPDGIYLVLKGDAVLLMTSDATNVIANFPAPAGSVLGVPAAVGHSEYSLTAIARKGTQIGFVKLALPARRSRNLSTATSPASAAPRSSKSKGPILRSSPNHPPDGKQQFAQF